VAVDAGAGLVVDHGSHQLRGIDVYKWGVIFYSLGNFFFDYSAVDPRTTDLYDAGIDFYRIALGTLGESAIPPPLQC
jgi:poly-gamma-glutamate capsule biosynthesis protein CapA/YwtB (metallophosphatase superfamily)